MGAEAKNVGGVGGELQNSEETRSLELINSIMGAEAKNVGGVGGELRNSDKARGRGHERKDLSSDRKLGSWPATQLGGSRSSKLKKQNCFISFSLPNRSQRGTHALRTT